MNSGFGADENEMERNEMALIKCSECGREISDKAAACIHCGCPISIAAQSAPAPESPRRIVNEPINNTPRSLSLDFNAVVSGADNEKSDQKVYVNELGREVEFSINNNTKVGETIKITLREGSKYDYILFTAVSVSRAQKASSAAAPSNVQSNKNAIRVIKSYDPNWFIEYLNSRRYYTIMMLCIGACVKFAMDGDTEVAFGFAAGTSPLWLTSLIGRLFYPMHHIKKYFRKNHIEDAIRSDTGYMNVAISAYNVMPGKKMLAYIRKLNPEAAQRIRQQLAAGKNK